MQKNKSLIFSIALLSLAAVNFSYSMNLENSETSSETFHDIPEFKEHDIPEFKEDVRIEAERSQGPTNLHYEEQQAVTAKNTVSAQCAEVVDNIFAEVTEAQLANGQLPNNLSVDEKILGNTRNPYDAAVANDSEADNSQEEALENVQEQVVQEVQESTTVPVISENPIISEPIAIEVSPAEEITNESVVEETKDIQEAAENNVPAAQEEPAEVAQQQSNEVKDEAQAPAEQQVVAEEPNDVQEAAVVNQEAPAQVAAEENNVPAAQEEPVIVPAEDNNVANGAKVGIVAAGAAAIGKYGKQAVSTVYEAAASHPKTAIALGVGTGAVAAVVGIVNYFKTNTDANNTQADIVSPEVTEVTEEDKSEDTTTGAKFEDGTFTGVLENMEEKPVVAVTEEEVNFAEVNWKYKLLDLVTALAKDEDFLDKVDGFEDFWAIFESAMENPAELKKLSSILSEDYLAELDFIISLFNQAANQ